MTLKVSADAFEEGMTSPGEKGSDLRPDLSSGRIRVVHLISDAGPHPYFRTFVEHADRDRFDLAVGCVGPAGPLQEEMSELGIDTFALGARSRRNLAHASWRLGRQLARDDIDIVQAHLPEGCAVGLVAARIARGPVGIHTAHHSHELPFHGLKLRAAERVLAGVMAQRVIAPSLQVASALADLGVAESKIEVVHHGFDLERLDPARTDGRTVRRELGLGDGLVIGTIGRDYFLKNHEGLIRAFLAASDTLGGARLLVVCRGGAPRLRDLVAGLGLEGRVCLTDTRDDIPNVLVAMDLYVHPAIAESFGMTIMEAMAMARPVVATPVGIVPEVLRDGVNGIVAGGPSDADLERALRRAVAIRGAWPQLGREARRVAERFTAQQMVAEHERLYTTWARSKLSN